MSRRAASSEALKTVRRKRVERVSGTPDVAETALFPDTGLSAQRQNRILEMSITRERRPT
jgi:hypothetical protein